MQKLLEVFSVAAGSAATCRISCVVLPVFQPDGLSVISQQPDVSRWKCLSQFCEKLPKLILVKGTGEDQARFPPPQTFRNTSPLTCFIETAFVWWVKDKNSYDMKSRGEMRSAVREGHCHSQYSCAKRPAIAFSHHSHLYLIWTKNNFTKALRSD